MAINGFAVTVLHAVDQTRRDLLAAIHQHAIGCRQTDQRCLTSTKRHGQQRRQIVIQSEPAGIILDLVHSQIHREARCHQIARLLDPYPHDRRPIETPCIVGRLPFRFALPLVNHKRRVKNARCRVISLIQRCQIDKWLEG